MKNSKLKTKNWQLLLCLLPFAFCLLSVDAQSTDANYPTPVTSNEISGTIAARDIGDARLTSYYYVFSGNQGDVFINIETRNLNGDIDVFAAEGLRPLSKIRLYADISPSETGRIIYLRKSDKLILRVEGRTPDDNPALFRIKFAGSFVAYEGGTESGAPSAPVVESGDKGTVRVNSVGTIIPETTVKNGDENVAVETARPAPPETAESTAAQIETPAAEDNSTTKNNKPAAETNAAVESGNPVKANRPAKTRRPARVKSVKTAAPEASEKNEPAAVNPLENVRLVVLMKDGAKIEYPMTEVFRFSLNNNVLTIILKDGKIERRSILDIQKFSVE